jgi:hypothetical protein
MIINRELTAATTSLDRDLLHEVMMLMFSVEKYVASVERKDRSSFECHSIARAIAMTVKKLKVVDGYYLGIREVNYATKSAKVAFCDHLWLSTPDGNIIGPYAVGFVSITPVLVANLSGPYSPFGGGLYVSAPEITKKIFTEKVRERSLLLASLIRKAQKKKGKH